MTAKVVGFIKNHLHTYEATLHQARSRAFRGFARPVSLDLCQVPAVRGCAQLHHAMRTQPQVLSTISSCTKPQDSKGRCMIRFTTSML